MDHPPINKTKERIKMAQTKNDTPWINEINLPSDNWQNSIDLSADKVNWQNEIPLATENEKWQNSVQLPDDNNSWKDSIDLPSDEMTAKQRTKFFKECAAL